MVVGNADLKESRIQGPVINIKFIKMLVDYLSNSMAEGWWHCCLS
jgi:hypothetical protein